MAVQCDVSDSEAAEGLVRDVEREWGSVDALINCIGPYHRVNLLEETPEGWLSMFANNLHPVFYCARAVAPGMKERGWGRILSFSMATADRISAQPQITAHFIAKSGILVLTRSLARLLAPHGITVNAISPGFIDSGSAPPEELEGMIKHIPAGYIGSTQDAASLACFLLSDKAGYITGANIHLSGGWGL
jgi:3-oxoacyl-[acyl-carrier protein] reductase